MSERLPSLVALRAFEAAARHMSFAQAANELSVTPAALSYQIKSLEADLGAPLFHRLNRAVELTEAGRILLRGLSTAFQDIRGAWNSAKRYVDPSRLTITAGPSFTAKWLAPRMFHFAEKHPDLELRFIATLKFVDFARDDVDIAIRFGFGEDPGLFSETLYEGFITPMMHPNVAARLNQPADLLHETLIHDDSLSFLPNPPNWDRWFEAVGVSHPLLKGPRFSQADHAVDLALEGNGVVMGRASITARHVRAGQLVAPFRIALTAPVQYRIVCPAGTENRPAVALFRNWAREEIEKDRSLGDGFEKIEIDQVRQDLCEVKTMKLGILEAGDVVPDLAARHGDYPAMFRALLSNADPEIEFETVHVVHGEMPSSPERADAWLVTGSRHGVYDDLPWIEPLKAFLRDCMHKKVPVVGICFGHQILAEAMGGKAEKSDRGWRLGLQHYDVVRRPTWMTQMPDHYAVLALHQDQVTKLSPNSTVLATNSFCEFAAIAYGDPEDPDAVTVQPHPEFGPEFMDELLKLRRDKPIPAAVVDDALENLAGPLHSEKWAQTIVDFLRKKAAGRAAA